MADRFYKIESLGRQLGIGVAGSRYVSLSAIAKENVPNAPYCVPNELICCELGRFIGLPVPPGAMVSQATGGSLFASLDFNLTANTLPPVDVAGCVKGLPLLSAGLLLFDIWVANLDRHPGNFAVDFLATPPEMNVFDHSHALFGYSAGDGENRLKLLTDRLGVSWSTNAPVDSGKHRHCLLDTVSSDGDFGFWIERISATPDFFIRDVCGRATSHGATADEIDAAIAFLIHRRNDMKTIVRLHQAEFTAIKTWSLFP
jgi:hypothetical protein